MLGEWLVVSQGFSRNPAAGHGRPWRHQGRDAGSSPPASTRTHAAPTGGPSGGSLDWCEGPGTVDLAMVPPGAASRFIEELPGGPGDEEPDACRSLEQLATASSPHHTADKTPGITVQQACELLDFGVH